MINGVGFFWQTFSNSRAIIHKGTRGRSIDQESLALDSMLTKAMYMSVFEYLVQDSFIF